MHKSRLGGFIMDCRTDDLDAAARFWSDALGSPIKKAADLKNSPYVELDTPPTRPYVEVQAVAHDSRVHIDIESDDVSAEVRRLESLGARRVDAKNGWVVLEAPTGQRFCVVPVVSEDFDSNANSWNT